jgi:HEPN domain-containing protein
MAQQTAVEYLLEKLYTEYRFAFSGTIVDEAKAMEKEQIMESYSDGVFDGAIRDEFYEDTKASGEQYYNETYNK